MLTGGHIAASYILTEVARGCGYPLNTSQVVGIIMAGNIIDLDFFAGFWSGKTGEAHHQNITHTPLGIFLIWGGTLLFFHPEGPTAILLLLLSMLIHLVLDDVGFWMYKLKLMKAPVSSQINWLYPFRPFRKSNLMTNNNAVLRYYLFQTWPIAVLEIMLIFIAIALFIHTRM